MQKCAELLSYHRIINYKTATKKRVENFYRFIT